MKNRNTKSNNSLKTFFQYTFIVASVIIVALSIRVYFILQKSVFDGHHIVIPISENNKLIKILGFNSDNTSISTLDVRNSDIDLNNYSNKLGLISETKSEIKSGSSSESIDSLLSEMIYNPKNSKTTLTIIDKIRLLIFSKTLKEKDFKNERYDEKKSVSDIDRQIQDLFSDNRIVSENHDIQIINTTDISGLGQKFERVVTNLGGNVVAVTSSKEKTKYSKIQYLNKESYTLKKLKRIFKFPSEKTNNRSFGSIAIIIGDDYTKTVDF